jgi:alpha-glucosidase
VCIYQGEELGLPQADLAYEDIVDPYGLNFWPEFKGRDGCRTPMPWSDAELHCGFSEGDPWLPIPEDHWVLSVERQECQTRSALNGFRRFYAWRRQQPALRWGAMRFVEVPEPLLVFFREHEDQHLLCCFNLSDIPQQIPLEDVPSGSMLSGHVLREGVLEKGLLQLPAWGCLFYQCMPQ